MTALATPVYRPTRDLPVNGHQPIHPINLAAWSKPQAASKPTDPQGVKEKLDADLQRSVHRSGHIRKAFYVVVLGVALAGQVSGAVEALGIPLVWAIPAVGALELGGIVVLNDADVRRRLGEKAFTSRLLSAGIAAWAVAFNWMAHDVKLLAGFFAGMSALGYLVWVMHTENQRRDRLRATGDLPPTTPAYEVVGHWIRHPWLTLRAKNLAKADERLGLYTSLTAARAEKRREIRTKAISKVLHREIRAAVDPMTADIAVAVYDLDEIAARLKDRADYDGLTDMIAVRLDPAHLGDRSAQVGAVRVYSVVGESPAQGAQPAPARIEAPTPGSPSQPTPNAGEVGDAQADTPTPAAQPTPSGTPTEALAHLGAAQPTPTAAPAQPKAPTKPSPAQPKTPTQGAQPTVPPTLHAGRPDLDAQVAALPELQVRRLVDLDKEFPQGTPAPGRDKAMKHMQASGYVGWASKEPAGKLVRLLGEIRAAQGAQPTPTEEAS
jgi:hypothetical protein